MKTEERTPPVMDLISNRLHQLGARTVSGYITAIIAAVLIFFAPEVGIVGGVCAVVIGAISAVLVHPHFSK